jgi:hypothetical protein
VNLFNEEDDGASLSAETQSEHTETLSEGTDDSDAPGHG